MAFHFRKLTSAGALLLATVLVGACGGDDGPVQPSVLPVPNTVVVTATGSTTARITFTGTALAASYAVERAAGASGGTFAQVATPTTGAAGAQFTFDDTGLTASTTYRYRVAAINGANRSAFSDEVTVQTLGFGNAAAVISDDITQNRTLFADTAYTLRGFIHVTNSATLTIQPGTTIKGDFNVLGSSLFVLQGAKINAVGTAAAPIVFTSSQPVGLRQPGDWGGLVIVGRGAINRSGDIEVEGTGTDGATVASGRNYRFFYSGGSDATNTDDSGELRYVRVEFAGFGPSSGNELNSLTFAAVGSGTRLSYLQSLSGLDDSFEWFGGTVNAHHLVSYEAGDDHFDMSEGYRGRLQYLIAYQDTVLTTRPIAGTPSTDPQGIENDGCNGTGCAAVAFNSTPFTVPVVANFTLVGTGSNATSGNAGGFGMMLRRGTGGHYVNGIVARWSRGAISIRDAATFERAGNSSTPDLATADLALRNILIVQTLTAFQPQTTGSTTIQNSFDLAGNAIVHQPATTASQIFTAFPTDASATTTEAALDWTPLAGSVAASTPGLSTFTGKLATAAAAVVTATNYVGAAQPAGPKWWAGWTRYAQQ